MDFSIFLSLLYCSMVAKSAKSNIIVLCADLIFFINWPFFIGSHASIHLTHSIYPTLSICTVRSLVIFSHFHVKESCCSAAIRTMQSISPQTRKLLSHTICIARVFRGSLAVHITRSSIVVVSAWVAPQTRKVTRTRLDAVAVFEITLKHA